MLHSLQALARPAVIERLILVVNHRARRRAGGRAAPACRTAGAAIALHLDGWPSLLPPLPPLALRVTPAGPARVVRPASAPQRPTCACSVDAANPRWLLARALAGEHAARRDRRRCRARHRRQLAVRQPALGRRGRPRPPVRRRPWRAQLARLGLGAGAAALRAARCARIGERGLLALRRRRRRGARGADARDEAPRPAGLHRLHGAALRARRAGAVGLPPALGARAGARGHLRPPPRRAARRAPAPGAGAARARSSSSSARCCRPGATCCRRTSPTSWPSCRTACRRSRRRRRARWSSGPSASRSTTIFASFDAEPVASASIAQVHFATLQGRPRGGGQGAAPGHAGGDRRRPALLRTLAALGRAAVGRRQAPEAARGGGRVRQLPARRARPGARGRQRRAAAPQHGRA